ncbi:MAG: hypothetical protein K2L85_05020, partial [Paramuribaculum sp.]|nr:hypothetical protein [Paramuribaculum sp.]
LWGPARGFALHLFPLFVHPSDIIVCGIDESRRGEGGRRCRQTESLSPCPVPLAICHPGTINV